MLFLYCLSGMFCELFKAVLFCYPTILCLQNIIPLRYHQGTKCTELQPPQLSSEVKLFPLDLKKKRQTSAMKERFQLYSSLYTDQKSSKTDLNDFSQYKNHEYPLTLSDYRKLQKPTAKSNFIKCLSQQKNQSHNNAVSVGYEWPYLDTVLIVSAKMVQKNAPNLAKIYKVYSKTEIEDKTVCFSEWFSKKRNL